MYLKVHFKITEITKIPKIFSTEDVVEDRNQFIKRWREYEKRMIMYDNDGNVDWIPSRCPVPKGH